MASNPEFVLLPDPFTDLLQPFQFNGYGPVQAGIQSSSASIKFQPFPFSVDLSDEFESQIREFDIFLHLENERLKRKIQDQKQQQQSTLLHSLQSVFLSRMRKTEHELFEAISKKTELENRLRRGEDEKEAWRRAATENEAVVEGLSEMLGHSQDAESACETRMVDDEGDRKMRCKGCGNRRSRVVLLPCRHFCACGECGGVLERCPVCGCVKQGCVEVFLC